MSMRSVLGSLPLLALSGLFTNNSLSAADPISELQQAAVEAGQSDLGHWGWRPDVYTHWGTHSNRLIPVYTFGTKGQVDGISLSEYTGENSIYRSEDALRAIYGSLPEQSVNSDADFLDQTNIYDIQLAAINAGKKHVILVVFDGMDWQTTMAAATYANKGVKYTEGRGTGLHFLDYTAGGTSEYGWMVTSPLCDDATVDVNAQTAEPKQSERVGGYCETSGGQYPWSIPSDAEYPVGKTSNKGVQHPYTDSASSATSMTAGRKTYNAAINVGVDGEQFKPLGVLVQERGYRSGAVTAVPISHATPAAAYANNVSRNDYQDLTRDMLGLKSSAHPDKPLAGIDLLIGCGFGEDRPKDNGQGDNFVAGNAYLTEADRQAVDARNGGPYVVATRQQGVSGTEALEVAVDDAIAKDKRLLGFFGVDGGHLPFQTADGDYKPTIGRKKKAEKYSDADVAENPTIADCATAALKYLGQDDKPFWLMVEAGDVDWANHDNNIDNSIGAVLSGDAAVKAVTDWVEANSNWDETVMIVTADHGHYLVLDKPEMLAGKQQPANE